MKLAKVFNSGHSQAVRLPKEFRFHCKEVEIYRQGKDIVLHEKPQNLAQAFWLLSKMPADFFEQDWIDTPPQERESF